MTDDLKFGEAVVDPSYRAIVDVIRSSELKITTRAFVANVDLVTGLLRTPTFMNLIGTYLNVAQVFEARRTWPDDAIDILINDRSKLKDPEFSDRVISWLVHLREKIREELENPALDAWGEQASVVGPLLKVFAGTVIHDGIRAILSSAITGTWTAFEVLVGDLWVACLNARPRLGFVALGAEPDPSDTPAVLNQKRKRTFILDPHKVMELDYNIKDHMGLLMRDKWNFSNRSEAKDAYLKVFKSSQKLKEIFEDENLKWLAATRNVIVHKAGKADSEFCVLVKTHPILGAVKKDEPIPIDGFLVNSLINPALNRGRELLEFVDDWLSKNKD